MWVYSKINMRINGQANESLVRVERGWGSLGQAGGTWLEAGPVGALSPTSLGEQSHGGERKLSHIY